MHTEDPRLREPGWGGFGWKGEVFNLICFAFMEVFSFCVGESYIFHMKRETSFYVYRVSREETA